MSTFILNNVFGNGWAFVHNKKWTSLGVIISILGWNKNGNSFSKCKRVHYILVLPNYYYWNTKTIYHSLGSIFKLTKQIIIIFQKKLIFKNLKLLDFHDLLWYCHKNCEIIQSVAYDNYDDFQHVNFIFSQKFISLFWGLFNDKTNLKIR
jgi:hypothetical protein